MQTQSVRRVSNHEQQNQEYLTYHFGGAGYPVPHVCGVLDSVCLRPILWPSQR
jgi:hypothetical protein